MGEDTWRERPNPGGIYSSWPFEYQLSSPDILVRSVGFDRVCLSVDAQRTTAGLMNAGR